MSDTNPPKLTGHRDLRVWQDAMTLVSKIYVITRDFPKDEQYGLSSQLRRAAVSVPSNIVEGAARISKREFGQFLSMTRGSLAEVDTQILIENELGYLTEKEAILALVSDLLRSISALMKSLENRR